MAEAMRAKCQSAASPACWLRALLASVAPLVSAAGQVSTATTSGAPVVTLPEARQRALRVDPVAVEATSNIRTAEWTRRSARADLFVPRLTGNLNYIRFSDPFFNFGTGAITPNAASATLEASWVLLGAGKFGIVRATRRWPGERRGERTGNAVPVNAPHGRGVLRGAGAEGTQARGRGPRPTRPGAARRRARARRCW